MAEDLTAWNPEDAALWESSGKRTANRNLWISIPSLWCGFAVWIYWGIVTVQMLNLGYPFTQSELFTLTAIAGLSGATLRIPSTFFIRIAGGRNTIFLTTALLILPSGGMGDCPSQSRNAVMDLSTSRAPVRFWRWQLRIIHVEYQLLLSQTGARSFSRS